MVPRQISETLRPLLPRDRCCITPHAMPLEVAGQDAPQGPIRVREGARTACWGALANGAGALAASLNATGAARGSQPSAGLPPRGRIVALPPKVKRVETLDFGVGSR